MYTHNLGNTNYKNNTVEVSYVIFNNKIELNIKLAITFGSGSNNGPIHIKIKNNIKHETREVICVLPPTVC